jgi:hypothetical protein
MPVVETRERTLIASGSRQDIRFVRRHHEALSG